MSERREVIITLVGIKEDPSSDRSDKMNNELGWGDGRDDPMEDSFEAPKQEKKGYKGGGPVNFRNRHYQNAYGNYRGGYGPQGAYGPLPGGFGPGPRPNFGPRPFYGPGPRPHFGMGPDFGPHPNCSWGRGFGPDGPPNHRQEQKVLQFLARCGVAKENMKNLPRSLLLMFEPEYCGLCALPLDSFTASRIHYVSKNHQKNQIKWFNQSEMGGQGGPHRREVPVKSRNLYCELCDVHITSKSHAESHYAGKPHRAIVEGRKVVKNPALLQGGMEHRLDMLIRREKKHLKVEDKHAVKEEPKPIAPELYCDICKTSVTCTEQMTMHLNGKRHLMKEKQHILKMMTGQVKECDAAGDAEQDNNGGAGEAGQHDFDWGNGSGNWDEPATDKVENE